MLFFDTETCGLHGPTVLIQYSHDFGEIYLHDVFKVPIGETLTLIEEFCEETVVGFNLAFDWFHLCQTYTTLMLLSHSIGRKALPEDHINEYAACEALARDGLCIKPFNAFDIMLHARKGPYQSTMNRSDITLKKVPTGIAWELADELGKRIPLNDVYFARRNDKTIRWQVMDIFDDLGDTVPDFKNVVLRFSPSSALKALAIDALGIKEDDILKFADISLPKKAMPVETGYAPYALAPVTKKHIVDGKEKKYLVYPSAKDWFGKWPEVIHMHISHWGFNTIARKYAVDDVVYTRDLYKYFGSPEPGDDDSILACMVGACRWRGYKLDIAGIECLKNKAEDDIAASKFNFNSPDVCRRYLEEALGETEKLVMKVNDKVSTKGVILEEIAKWKEEKVCDCLGDGCDACGGDGLLKSDEPHEAANRATAILDFRHSKKEIELYDKLLVAGRFHASFVVIGTLSTRMAGGDGLNPQGIKRATYVRACFPLAWDGMQLDGGDFEGFEVCLADAVYGDPKLRELLQTGKKIHAIFGTYLFPPMTYEDIMATKGLPGSKDKYGRSKNGVFAMLYGGEEYTLQTRVGINEEDASKAYQQWCGDFVVWGEERRKYFDMFCSMRQPGGIGSKVEWHEPSDYIESMLGFKRYFTLENKICKALFQLAEKPPEHWSSIKANVTRRDRIQTTCGAARSALFAAAFAVQASNMRAAANHVIQSSGATITKKLQRNLWEIQPYGINHWRIQPFNVHDEVMAPVLPQYSSEVTRVVNELVEELKPLVPLISMDWSDKMKSWAEK
jgi:hypothetical protein